MSAPKLYGDNGHDQKLIKEFNRIAKNFDVTELPELLECWMDDSDLHSFTESLKDRIYENTRSIELNHGETTIIKEALKYLKANIEDEVFCLGGIDCEEDIETAEKEIDSIIEKL